MALIGGHSTPELCRKSPFGMVLTSYGNLIGGCDQMGFSGTTQCAITTYQSHLID